jgi:hypothetical protein
MSNDTRPFAPLYNQTQYTQAGTTSSVGQVGSLVPSITVAASNGAAVASTAFPGTNNNEVQQILVSNKTSVWVHVNFGNLQAPNTVRAATVNDLPVPPGGQAVFTVDPEVNASSVFADGAPAASTSVVFTRGSGMF